MNMALSLIVELRQHKGAFLLSRQQQCCAKVLAFQHFCPLFLLSRIRHLIVCLAFRIGVWCATTSCEKQQTKSGFAFPLICCFSSHLLLHVIVHRPSPYVAMPFAARCSADVGASPVICHMQHTRLSSLFAVLVLCVLLPSSHSFLNAAMLLCDLLIM
jgi:hypothetical protein